MFCPVMFNCTGPSFQKLDCTLYAILQAFMQHAAVHQLTDVDAAMQQAAAQHTARLQLILSGIAQHKETAIQRGTESLANCQLQ